MFECVFHWNTFRRELWNRERTALSCCCCWYRADFSIKLMYHWGERVWCLSFSSSSSYFRRFINIVLTVLWLWCVSMSTSTSTTGYTLYVHIHIILPIAIFFTRLFHSLSLSLSFFMCVSFYSYSFCCFHLLSQSILHIFDLVWYLCTNYSNQQFRSARAHCLQVKKMHSRRWINHQTEGKIEKERMMLKYLRWNSHPNM